MSLNAAIDVAIALALMYLLLSLTCTVVNEYIAAKLSLRSKSLAIGLQELLDDPAVRKAFYEHGLIAATKTAVTKADAVPLMGSTPAAPSSTAPTPSADKAQTNPPGSTTTVAPGQHPSYVSAETFVLALVGSLVKQSAAGQPAPVFADVQKAIQDLPPSRLKDVLVTNLTVAEGNFEKFRKNVATWFDDSMDRLSGTYKRHLKVISIVVGCAVALVLNADTLKVGRALWSDSSLRAQMVQVASETVKAPPSTPSTPQAPPSIDDIKKSLTHADEQLRPLPIGWSSRNDWSLQGLWALPSSLWLLKVLGLFLTGLALSFGAPFWFDFLSQFMNLRSTGAKPQRQK